MRNGYKKFISKIDPCTRSTTAIPKILDLDSVCVNDLTALHIVAYGGAPHSLWEAFTWRTTVQGHYYWRDRAQEFTPLSDDDMDYLRSLYEYWRDRDSNS